MTTIRTRHSAVAVPSSFFNNLITTLGVPIALTFLAGRRYFPLWAVLHHVGRKSGRDLRVPVAVRVKDDTVLIPLLFGPRTNWVRNVQAAGVCTIRWKARHYRLVEPELVTEARARAYFSDRAWAASEKLVAPEGFLLLRRSLSAVGGGR